MRLLTLPGVYPPETDSQLLAEALRDEPLSPHARVLDVCTGTGLLAVSAAARGVRAVTAIDACPRAVATARLNAALHRAPIRVLQGDLFAPVAGEQFDLVLANPPYVPAATDTLPTEGIERAWDGGRDGRALLDRICAGAARLLSPGGVLLVVHSHVCDTARTLADLEAGGLSAQVVGRRRIPYGPVMTARAEQLVAQGLAAAGSRHEEVVVVRARRVPFTDEVSPPRPGARSPSHAAAR